MGHRVLELESLSLAEVFRFAKENGLTDLKMVGNKPVYGGIVKRYRPLPIKFIRGGQEHYSPGEQALWELVEATAPISLQRIKEILEGGKFYDYAFSIKDFYRVRVQVAICQDGLSLSLRLLTYDIPDVKVTRLPVEVVQILSMQKPGLILHTGGTSSGKSTTIASEVDYLASRLDGIILTFENPVEYRYVATKAVVQQFEIPTDIRDYSEAVVLALRADPTVIVFGEVRAKEEILALVDLANRGHLVIATLHTANVEQTIEYFGHLLGKEGMSLFGQQLLAIVSHYLHFDAEKKKIIPVHDYLVPNSDTIRQHVMNVNVKALRELRETMYRQAKANGMLPYTRTFKHSVEELYGAGEISERAKQYLEGRLLHRIL